MKVSTRLALGFGSAVALGVAIAAFATLRMNALAADLDAVSKDRLPKIARAAHLKDNFNGTGRAARNIVIHPDPAFRASEKKLLVDARADNARLLKELDATINLPKARALLDSIVEQRVRYSAALDKVVEMAEAGRSAAEVGAYLDGEMRQLQTALFKTVDEFIDTQMEASVELADAAAATAKRDSAWMLALAAVIALLGGAMGWALTRSLNRALGAEPDEVSEALQRVADGDLSKPLALRSGSDAASVMATVQRMQRSLAQTVGTVRNNADGVATASMQIARGNQDLSQRTEEQASALQQTAATMDELGTTVRQNADNAHQADQLAKTASTVAEKGGTVVSQVVETMKGIDDASKKIADIIAVIDGIAFQTNILALNAAVEAARAGEQGRGFAVVAGEVRNLAQRSAEAAKEVKRLITDSVERVERGTALADDAGATMGEIVAAIRRVTDIMGEIAGASAEQSRGVSQVGEAVSQMDKTTQQNAALVEESAAAAESLRQQAQALVQAVGVFKLERQATRSAPPVARVAAPVAAPVAKRPTAKAAAVVAESEEWAAF